MSERSTEHATFVVEHTYDAAPARVFAAWASAEAKDRWFGGPSEGEPATHELDFRVGGREIYTGGGSPYVFEARYQDIVPDQRITYTYTMDRDKTRISVSLATIEFKPAGKGTHLKVTEQGVFLDGEDKPDLRAHGTKFLLESLDESLKQG